MRIPQRWRTPSATGMSDRGRNSNSSSSTASSTAETGAPNVAAMPAAAPAASSVFRSAAVVLMICPMSEPSAPPVAMIGPSAPNGPPVPIAIAARKRLEKRDSRRDAALVEQHLFHRLGDAVPANRLVAVARHEADDHAADDRHEDHPPVHVGAGLRRRAIFPAECVMKRKVGDQPDQVDQDLGNECCRRRQQDRQALIKTTRPSTSDDCAGTAAASRAGARDGETGRPSVVEAFSTAFSLFKMNAFCGTRSS